MTQPFVTETHDNVRIHVLPTSRFKTFSMSIYIGYPLAEDSVSEIALIPFVLRRGTESWPETKRFREQLENLYGAGFGFDVYKRGGSQIVQFRMDTIHDRFIRDDRSLLAESLKYLGEVLTKPALEEGVFRKRYVDAEKTTVQKRIEAVINDKIRYAAERCIEEMFAGDPYRLLALGRRQDLPDITAAQLFETYSKWLREASIDVYVVGQTTPEEVKQLVSEHFAWRRDQAVAYTAQPKLNKRGEVQTIVERIDVNQGKLNLGLRTGVTFADDEYPAALVFNGIFGGYPHAKLFMNVREKASLAYYASSRLDGHKGILTVQSGIEFANYERTLQIIMDQLEAMRQGDFGELEWSQTQAMLANQLREMQDSAFEMIGFDFNSVLSGRARDAEGLIRDIEQLQPEDVKKVAEGVELDTVYFLRNREGAE